MAVLVLVLVAALAISQTDQVNGDERIDSAGSSPLAFAGMDEGDIGQIFGTTGTREGTRAEAIQVVIEKPLVPAPVDCYKATELVRDLTVPYEQRSYIQSDGSSCTPVN